MRPGREHETTCAKAAEGPLPALEALDGECQVPTPADPGYPAPSPAIRHPHKKPKGGEPTDAQTTYNTLIRGVHRIGERANSPLKTTYKALRHVSLDPWRTGATTKAAPAPPTPHTTGPSPEAPRVTNTYRERLAILFVCTNL